MKNLKILMVILTVFTCISSFAQKKSHRHHKDPGKDTLWTSIYSGSMESGLWKYGLYEEAHDSLTFNMTERIIFYEEDSMWNYVDSLYKKLIKHYTKGSHIVSLKTDDYHVFNVNDSVITIVPGRVNESGGKICAINFYLSYTTFYIEEEYNKNAGYYYMSGTFTEARDRIIKLLNQLSKT